MKKWVIMVLTIAFVLTANRAFAVGISNSVHNFTKVGDDWNTTGEICRVCHVPHDNQSATQRYLNGLLWNHELSSASYTMYDSSWSSTIDNTASAQPDGTAKLCLGCHDGTIAIDSFGSIPGDPNLRMGNYNRNKVVPQFSDGSNLDLRGTHPISIVYDPSVDQGLNSVDTAMGTSGTIEDVLDNGKVQCSSCHDVHGQEIAKGRYLLRVSQTTKYGGTVSGLCLTCHNK